MIKFLKSGFYRFTTLGQNGARGRCPATMLSQMYTLFLYSTTFFYKKRDLLTTLHIINKKQ